MTQVALPAASCGDVGAGAKLGQVIDQSLDGDFTSLSRARVDAAFARYQAVMEGPPPPDLEPTADQLAALSHVVEKRLDPPYVDFSVFCPHALRMQRKMRLAGLVLAPDGRLFRSEMSGPATYEQWESCYAVFSTACVMLEIIAPAALDNYRDHIRGYAHRYPSAVWPLVFQADTRARRELSERIRRRVATEHASLTAAALTSGSGPVLHPFDSIKPWKYVWGLLSGERTFWSKEVEEPGILIMTGAIQASSLTAGEAPVVKRSRDHLDCLVQPEGAPAIGHAAIEDRPNKPRGPRIGQREKVYKVDASGTWTHNRMNKEICPGWTRGECLNLPCAANPSFVHQCSKCLSPWHGSHQNRCGQEVKGKGKAGKGGKGKGKGKSYR